MLETQDKYEFRIRWLPYFNRPGMPPEGIPKPLIAPGDSRVPDRLKVAGESCGIEFTGKADIYPNTAKAHALLQLVKSDYALQSKLAEELYKAYFTDGSILLDVDLLRIAESVGISRALALSVLQNEKKVKEVTAAAASWREEVSGCPTYYINGKLAFSGANEKDKFIEMFKFATKRLPLEPLEPGIPNSNSQ